MIWHDSREDLDAENHYVHPLYTLDAAYRPMWHATENAKGRAFDYGPEVS